MAHVDTSLHQLRSIRYAFSLNETMSTTQEQSSMMYNDLKSWIESVPGGFIHPSLSLFDPDSDNKEAKFANRGVKSTSPIPVKTLLIRLPISLALSGQNETVGNNSTPAPSPWLRCIGQLILEKKLQDVAPSSSPSHYAPYFKSLPTSFDTIQTWSLKELETYLSGTALGEMALLDQNENLTRVRFEKSVKPYCQKLFENHSDSALKGAHTTWEDFLWASQCLSTRGFHMEKEEGSTTTRNSSSYPGPYLLPYIDLLNHDPIQKCTTLQHCFSTNESDSKKNPIQEPFFQMIAERDIASGEEIFHSYYSIHDTTTSNIPDSQSTHNTYIPAAQLLQTFGFVSRHHMESALQYPFSDNKQTENNEDSNDTDAVLTLNDIKESCRNVAFSSWVEKFRSQSHMEIDDDEDEDEDEMYWDPKEAWDDKITHLQSKQTFLPDQILASRIDEIATCCVMLLLPDDAFRELFVLDENPGVIETNQIFGNSGNANNDDDDAEDDPWLGTLVGMAVLDLVQKKAENYSPKSTIGSNRTLVSALKENMDNLSLLLRRDARSTEIGRQMAGLTIQIEEQKSLERLRRNALDWISFNVGSE